MISATDGDGVADLKRILAERAPPGPWHYAADDLSDAPMRMHGGRDHAREDLPAPARRAALRRRRWRPRRGPSSRDGSVRIEQTIYVERDGQKAIVLGKGGRTIKQLSMESRRELTQILGAPGAPLPVRQGARGLAERPRALPRDGPRAAKEAVAGARNFAGNTTFAIFAAMLVLAVRMIGAST